MHTVHLWQPSGNRPNKPKMPGEKKRKGGDKKRNQVSILKSSQKRVTRKKKSNEPPPPKRAPSPECILPEPLEYHNPENSKYQVS